MWMLKLSRRINLFPMITSLYCSLLFPQLLMQAVYTNCYRSLLTSRGIQICSHCRHIYWHCSSVIPIDLSSVQKSLSDVCLLFRFWRIFQRFLIWKMLQNFRFLFLKRALSEVFSVEYFLEIFQSRHLPTLKIGII